MNLVYRLQDLHLTQPVTLTIGVFDGVHRGHQALIQHIVARAESQAQIPVVLTFHPHPDAVVGSIDQRYYLTTPQERAERMHALGVEWVVVHDFDDHTRQIRARDFVASLQDAFDLRELWVGADFALGYQREGTVALLEEIGQACGFSVSTFDLIKRNGDTLPISSQVIRQQLAQGHIQQVNNWLGYAYTLQGTVVAGDRRGRQIGFPTANLAVSPLKVLPEYGVYAGHVTIGSDDESSRRFMAVANIGMRPTFDGHEERVEVHLLDFGDDLYGRSVRFTLEHHLRPEIRFDGIDSIRAQLRDDVTRTRQLLSDGAS